MSSASFKRETVHACAAACTVTPRGIRLPKPERCLCYAFSSGHLHYDGDQKARTTTNPNGVSCQACMKILRERGQLYAIMLNHHNQTPIEKEP